VTDLAPGAKLKFIYKYDFGDSWEHEVLVEEVLPPDPDFKHPVCLGGANACPPEDCGGIPGYYDLLAALDCQGWFRLMVRMLILWPLWAGVGQRRWTHARHHNVGCWFHGHVDHHGWYNLQRWSSPKVPKVPLVFSARRDYNGPL
jgi:hypothetical protein